jgi:hypothetical protein
MLAIAVIVRDDPDRLKRRDISRNILSRQRARDLAQSPVRRHDRRMVTDLAQFKASLSGKAPPAGLGGALAALWHAAKGDWARAHELAQEQDDTAGAWVHAYLHRVEGDQSNAGYWYRRAGKPTARTALETEWDEIARALLSSR